MPPALLASVVLVGQLAAQGPDQWDPRRVHLTRPELQALADQLKLAVESKAYGTTLRARALTAADLTKARLREGDVRVGDRILLEVEGEAALNDTFTVALGRTVTLPALGAVPLAGVLWSELDSVVTRFVSQFVRTPRVRARALIQVAIDGAVLRPGFYTVQSEEMFSNTLMLAGGPAANANTGDMRVERGSGKIREGQALRDALNQGRTLDQLDVRSGDRIFVPRRTSGLGGAQPAFQTVSMILAIPLTILTLTRVF